MSRQIGLNIVDSLRYVSPFMTQSQFSPALPDEFAVSGTAGMTPGPSTGSRGTVRLGSQALHSAAGSGSSPARGMHCGTKSDLLPRMFAMTRQG